MLAQTGKASEAIQAIRDAITELRPIGATVWRTAWLAHLSLAYAELGKLDDAWRCIGEAITAAETSKERWFEVEIYRIAGELALMSPNRDMSKRRGISSELSRFSQTESQVLGTARRDEHGATLARQREAAASSRIAGARVTAGSLRALTPRSKGGRSDARPPGVVSK